MEQEVRAMARWNFGKFTWPDSSYFVPPEVMHGKNKKEKQEQP
jgi:hypothetical protein